MELQELQQQWDAMNKRVDQLEIINKKQIMEIAQQKYRSKFSKLFNIELVGALMCFVFGIVILMNLGKMNTWYLMLSSIIGIAGYIVFPIITLRNIKKMEGVSISDKSYSDVISEFAKRKKNLLLVQKFSGIYALIIMFVTIPVSDMILNNKDFFLQEHNTSLWMFFGIAFVGIFFFARYGYNWYKRISDSAESVIEELKD